MNAEVINMGNHAALPESILFYDGECGLCHGFVRFVLRWDAGAKFYFAPLQGELAKKCLWRHGVDTAALNSVVLMLDGGTPQERLLVRSTAAVAVIARLGQPMATLAAMMKWFPSGLRDGVYGLVARYRYKVFGKVRMEGEVCALPSPAQRGRFL